ERSAVRDCFVAPGAPRNDDLVNLRKTLTARPALRLISNSKTFESSSANGPVWGRKQTEETMVDPTRRPGSREEDAWLSDEQLQKWEPAETDPFQAPVPTRMVSNGEYMPFPQTRQQQHVEYRIKELAETASKKLGISRRQFLEGTGGLAASFIAIN